MIVELPELYDAQKPVLKALRNKEDKVIVLNGSRQVGKTLLLSITAIYWALEANNQHIMIVSPTDSQVKKVYKQILLILENGLNTLVKSSKIQAGDSEIQFVTGSAILFRSAAAENSLRGYSNTHLLLDEAAWMKEETLNTIIYPTMSVRGKKMFLCSTPRGKNFFAKEYSRGVAGEKGYKSFKITYHQNPYANLEFINSQMRALPSEIFAQEYLGEFIDATGIFKYVDQIAQLVKKTTREYGKQYYVGVDIAFKRDYTVAICIDQDFNMVDYIRFNQTDTNILLNNLKGFFDKWQPTKIVIEENNQGVPVIDGLRNMSVVNIDNFNTNSKSKNELINKFMSKINNKEMLLLNEDVIKEEFKNFTYSLTKNGNVTFAAAFGHDDIVMASAFAFEAASSGMYKPLIFI